ncbi:hypothetical protein [Alteromonas stellipolaris]|uniref:hypothetical protein n=1 Tax=Alteromonas stellipolaris TaxID=233316 RepID=UPI003BAB10BE
MDEDLVYELSLTDKGLASELAKLYSDKSGQISPKQLGKVQQELDKASDCDISGSFAGFDDENVCEDHADYK